MVGGVPPTMPPCSWHSRVSERPLNGDTSATAASNLAGRSRYVFVADDRKRVTRRRLHKVLNLLEVLEPLDLLRTQPRGLSRSPGCVRGIGIVGLRRHVSITHFALPH